MSTTPNKRVTEAHRATAQAALEEAGISVESVADEFNTNPEHWNLKHCRKALRKAGYSATETEEALAEADTAPLPPAPEDGPVEEAAVDAAEPEHACPTCADWGGEEVGCDTDCYGTCTTRDPEEGTEDHWRPCNFERRCETCARHGTDYPDDCESCWDSEALTRWTPSHPAFALSDEAPEATADAVAGREDTSSTEKTTDATKGNDTPVILRSKPDLKWQGEESVTVTQPLTAAEKLEYANDMARALREKRDLEASLKAEQDHYKPLIKAADAAADKAARAFEEGKEEREVFCDKLFDFDAGEVVWADAFSGEIVQRRRMTHEEKQLPLPMSARGGASASAATDNADAPAVEAEPDTAPISVEAHDAPPPTRECFTCAHNMTRVELYPCAGCSLNPEAGHTGDDDRWSAKDGQEVAAPVDEAGDAAMPAADEHAESDDAGDEDDLAADTLEDAPEDMDADMPSVPPLSPSEDLHDLTQ